MSVKSLSFVFVVIATFYGHVLTTHGEEDLPALIRQEAIASQSKYRQELIQGISAKCRYQLILQNGSDRSVESSDSQFAFQFPSVATEIHFGNPTSSDGGQPKTGDRATVVNTRYAFELTRYAGSSSWMVTSIATDDLRSWQLKGRAEGLKLLSPEQMLTHRKIPVLDVEGVPIEDLLADSQFEIARAIRTDDDRIQIEFVGEFATPSGPDKILGGQVWLNPSRWWTVDEYRLTLSTVVGKSDVHRKTSWTKIDGLAVPEDVEVVYVAEREPPVTNKWTFTEWTRDQIPGNRFSLSYYGLPEPGMPPAASTSNSTKTSRGAVLLWGNIAGAVLIGIGILTKVLLQSNKHQSNVERH